MADCAVAASAPGATVRISTRRLRGVALIRVVAEEALGDGMEDGSLLSDYLAAASIVAEDAGGTLIDERANGRLAVSARLPIATLTGDRRVAC
jgi:hypothetical protein